MDQIKVKWSKDVTNSDKTIPTTNVSVRSTYKFPYIYNIIFVLAFAREIHGS